MEERKNFDSPKTELQFSEELSPHSSPSPIISLSLTYSTSEGGEATSNFIKKKGPLLGVCSV